MKRNILIFGLILGAILATNVVIMMNRVYNNPDIQSNDVVGYAAMIIVFSLIFFGIRNYRNKELNGTITFGNAFKIGVLIAFVGSTMYVIVGLGYMYLAMPDFVDKYCMHVMIQATRNGATEAELALKSQEMEQFKEMYKSPFFAILISYFEVLPVGLVVALVSSLILKRKEQSVPVR
ncbi:MAG TPA: DUF4199 domain-containing protein [Cyclobacteriaceae bacterium]|nr:DUF4199 domain-containing protein [Cyclobacteriaceae bacterium]